jgi:hypothetical protein
VAALVFLVAVASACSDARGGGDAAERSDRPRILSSEGTPPASAQTERQGALRAFRSRREHAPVAEPVALRIPQIGVQTSLERLRRAADGSVEVPRDPASAGWYAQGPRPGQLGPAVLLGHVDSREGPAVFFRLHELKPGQTVVVARSDGGAATFRVTGKAQYPKDRFPTDLVYYPTLHPEIRLVTCGGTIDPRTGHYRDNIIVFAVLAA